MVGSLGKQTHMPLLGIVIELILRYDSCVLDQLFCKYAEIILSLACGTNMKLSSICSTDNMDQGEDEELTQKGVGFLWPQSPLSTKTELGSVIGKFTHIDWLLQ